MIAFFYSLGAGHGRTQTLFQVVTSSDWVFRTTGLCSCSTTVPTTMKIELNMARQLVDAESSAIKSDEVCEIV